MSDIVTELLKEQENWRKDLRLCAYSIFTDYLTKQQEEVLLSVSNNKETYVKSGHSFGKSLCAATAVGTFMMSFFPCKVITFAPSWDQVEKILWSELRAMWRGNNIINRAYDVSGLGGSLTLTELKFSDDHFAIGISPRIEEEDWGKRVTGFHSPNLLIVMDEGPSIDERLWDMIDTLLTGANTRLLAIGNPTKPSGAFYNGFVNSTGNKISLSIFETPNFEAAGIKKIEQLRAIAAMPEAKREEYLAKLPNPVPALVTVAWAVKMLMKWGEDNPLFQSRVLANFPKKGGDGLISLYDLEICTKVTDTKPSIKSLGVDPSRVKDRFVMFGMENFKEIYRKIQPGKKVPEAAREIARIALDGEYDVIAIDVGGLGVGVFDCLNEIKKSHNKFPAVFPINNGAKPTSEHEKDCHNLITELWFVASRKIDNHEINIKDEDTLFSELLTRKWELDKDGKHLIEPKKDYKKRTKKNESPDLAESFLYSLAGIIYANPGTRKLRSAIRGAGGSIHEEYD